MNELDLRLTSINENDYFKLQALMSKGANIPLDGMDFADAFGILSLMYDLGIPLNKIYLGGGLEACKNFRDLSSELPYNCHFACKDDNGQLLNVDFVVKGVV